MSGRKPTFYLLVFLGGNNQSTNMAFDVEQIRATAQRVAASHGLDVVDLEFHGGAKHRLLRVFIEKNVAERSRLSEEIGATAKVGADPKPQAHGGEDMDRLAGVTHADCEAFSRDFGTVLDVEDLIPGADYTLEVSSPGLDRKLFGIEDFRRFSGMLAKVQTFEPVEGNRHWQGWLREVSDASVKLELQGRNSRKSKKATDHGPQAAENVEIALSNIEKAQLVPEF
ncbi:MAG TPA: ribosome maturation factor RimP [Acidobacteriaceae bacterium]